MEYNLNAMDAWKAMQGGKKVRHSTWPIDKGYAGIPSAASIRDQNGTIMSLPELFRWYMQDDTYIGWGVLGDRASFCGEKE